MVCKFDIMENAFSLLLILFMYVFACILISSKIIVHDFCLPYFHVSNSALFLPSTTVIFFHVHSLDTLYCSYILMYFNQQIQWAVMLYWLSYIHYMYSGPQFNIKMTSYQYRKSHCGDKMILRLSYLHNGISYTGKTTSLYLSLLCCLVHIMVLWWNCT